MPANTPEDAGAEVAALSRPRQSRLRRVLEYAGGAVLGLIGVVVLAAFALGVFGGILSSPSPGDPSSAGVVDSQPFWSPDSHSIAFDRSGYGPPGDTPVGSSDVFVASADGRDLRRLTRTPDNETVLGWLARPVRIVYARYGESNGPTELYALDPRGGAPAGLGEVRAGDELVALSHDGRRALVAAPRLDPERYALVDLARATRRPLPGTPGLLPFAGHYVDGVWSRDDSMLAYVTEGSIVIVRGERILRRVPLGQYDSATGGLAWSPDGRRLAYAAGGDNSSIWVVRVGDGSRARLTGGGDTSDLDPVWSPDGRTIYYESGSFDDDDGLRAIAPDGTRATKISDDDWGDFFSGGKNDRWLEGARISPDGTKIAYLLGERGAWKNWSLVGVMNADGSGKTPFPASD